MTECQGRTGPLPIRQTQSIEHYGGLQSQGMYLFADRKGQNIRRICILFCVFFSLVCSFPAYGAQENAGKNKSAKIRLFGTVEFRGPLKTLPAWLSVLERNAKNPIFVPKSRLNSKMTWDDFKAKAEKLSPMEQLKMVNSFWNQWPYREDIKVYGKPDYWAIPAQFRKNSGDCEDYSIAKYFTLRALGFPPEQMRIVVLMETIRNIAHAVLVVYLDGDAYVLDNLSRNVLSHTRYRNYLPQFSVNEKNRWVHVRPK